MPRFPILGSKWSNFFSNINLQKEKSYPLRGHFFYYVKCRNGKRCPLAGIKIFWHLKTFCNLDRARSIETDLQAWFWLNLPYSNDKKFSKSNVKKNSHSQINTFCHFNLQFHFVMIFIFHFGTYLYFSVHGMVIQITWRLQIFVRVNVFLKLEWLVMNKKSH